VTALFTTLELLLGHSLREVVSLPNLLIRVLHSRQQRHDSQVLLLDCLDHIEVSLAYELVIFVCLITNEVNCILFFVDSRRDGSRFDHLAQRGLK